MPLLVATLGELKANLLRICGFQGNHGLFLYMGISKNIGTPKSSILIGFSIINHPFWGTPLFGNTHIYIYIFFFFGGGGHCAYNNTFHLPWPTVRIGDSPIPLTTLSPSPSVDERDDIACSRGPKKIETAGICVLGPFVSDGLLLEGLEVGGLGGLYTGKTVGKSVENTRSC